MEGHETLFNFVMIAQPIVVGLCGIFFWSLVSMYLGFCTETVIQFKILSEYLEGLNLDDSTVYGIETNRRNKIKICIRHHQLILR